jgi:hypothetical protein
MDHLGIDKFMVLGFCIRAVLLFGTCSSALPTVWLQRFWRSPTTGALSESGVS